MIDAGKSKVLTGTLRYTLPDGKQWEATVQRWEPTGEYVLMINTKHSGAFQTSDAAVKFARDMAHKKFGAQPAAFDSLGQLKRILNAGAVVPLCYQAVPENSQQDGRGLDDCPRCPYRFGCGNEGQAAPVVIEQAESSDALIARIQAKLRGLE